MFDRRRLAGGLLLAAVLAAAVVALASQRDVLRDELGSMSWTWVVVSIVPAFVGTVLSARAWQVVLSGFGHALPARSAWSVFFVGQMGKYLPGGLWPVVTHASLARGEGVPSSAIAYTTVTSIVVSLGSAITVAAAFVVGVDPVAAGQYWWLLMVLAGCAGLLHPRTIRFLTGLAARVVGKPDAVGAVPPRTLLAAIGWSIASWVLIGVHVACLAAAAGEGGAEMAVRSIGAFALAWSVGFVVIVAPAGVGVREAAFVLVAGRSLGTETALAVAVVSRLVLTMVDLGVGGVSMGVLGRRRRLRPDPPATEASSP